MMQATIQPLIHRPDVAAGLLGVSTATLYRMAADGKIKVVRIGKRASGVTQSELDRFLEQIGAAG